MASIRSAIFSLLLGLIFILSVTTVFYKELSLALFIIILIVILDKLGKGIILRELIAFYTAFVCLVVPVLGYEVYNRENYLANLLRRYMRVPEDVYFSFALPAITLFILALCWPVKESGLVLDEGTMLRDKLAQVKKHLSRNYLYGFYLMAVGVAASFLLDGLPSGIQYFITLFYFASFAGVLYIYFAPPFKTKKIILLLFAFFIIWGALRSGMFTVVAYMGITIFSFFFVGRNHSLLKKFTVFLSAFFLILVLQNAKTTYRDFIWKKAFSGDRTTLFTSLFIENFKKGEGLIDKRTFFPVYMRTNQGFNVSLVMVRIPEIKPHDNGRAIATAVISSFVPRFLWPDKPEAGGKFNMEYFAGWKIRGWSTNVGPLGEAYGSFGVTGGIIYMFFLGLFIRWAYKKVFSIGRTIPLIICWIPVLFYQVTYSAETDTLQIFNSLVKTAFFMWLLYKFIPGLFGKQKEINSTINARLIAKPA